jgi:hypothetical protein
MLSKFTLGDALAGSAASHRDQAVTMTTEMTEANFGGRLKQYETQLVASFLPKCT